MTARPPAQWKNRLAGCAIGCGLFLVIAVVLLFSFFRWVSRPGPQIATEAVIGAESSGFIRLQHLATDEGAMQFLRTSLSHLDRRRMDRLERPGTPAVFRWLGRLGREPGDRAEEIAEGMPREITLTIESLPEREPRLVVAANLAKFPRLMRLGSSVVGLVRGVQVHGQHVYQDYGESGSVAFVENTIIWAPEGDLIRTVLDRIDRSAVEGSPDDEVHGVYSELAERWDLFGSIERGSELVPWLLTMARQSPERVPEVLRELIRLEPQLRAIEQARFGFDIVSDQVLEGELSLQLKDAASARTWKQLAGAVRSSDFGFRVETVLEGRTAVMQLRTDRLAELMSRILGN